MSPLDEIKKQCTQLYLNECVGHPVPCTCKTCESLNFTQTLIAFVEQELAKNPSKIL